MVAAGKQQHLHQNQVNKRDLPHCPVFKTAQFPVQGMCGFDPGQGTKISHGNVPPKTKTKTTAAIKPSCKRSLPRTALHGISICSRGSRGKPISIEQRLMSESVLPNQQLWGNTRGSCYLYEGARMVQTRLKLTVQGY